MPLFSRVCFFVQKILKANFTVASLNILQSIAATDLHMGKKEKRKREREKRNK